MARQIGATVFGSYQHSAPLCTGLRHISRGGGEGRQRQERFVGSRRERCAAEQGRDEHLEHLQMPIWQVAWHATELQDQDIALHARHAIHGAELIFDNDDKDC